MDAEEKYKQLKQALANTPADAATQNNIVKKIDGGFQRAYQAPDEVQVWTLNEYNSIPALTSLDLSALTSVDLSTWNSANTAPHANTSVSLAGTGGSGSTTTWTVGGGGGGSGGGQYTYPSSTTGTGNWQKPYGSGKIKIEADDIEIQGKSLLATLERIEQRLGLLDCDESMEAHWDELKSLGEKYRELKQHIEDKMKTFETLKKMPKPEIK